MKAHISARLLTSKEAQPADKAFEIGDIRLRGFILRVQPSGARSYYAQVGRGRRVVIGAVGHLTPDEARERCEKILGNVAHDRPPLTGIDGTDQLTLGQFIGKDGETSTITTYRSWLKANRPRYAERTLKRLETLFGRWYPLPLQEITVERLEKYRIGRLADGTSAQTVLRDFMMLSAVLTRAVKQKAGNLRDNPVRSVDKPKIDRNPKKRFLSPAEEQRLRAALTERDAEMQAARTSANQWRKDRRQEQMSPLLHYGDHLTPAVLLSLNTGLRRGELLALRWTDIDLRGKVLTVEGDSAKSSQTRHVPLNDEAVTVLKNWRAQNTDSERVIDVSSGFKSAFAALLTRAHISKFRWHDLRHTFASKLAQASVALIVIKELLGHQSMMMTMRYAHLAPNNASDAVAKLMEARA